MSKPLSNNNNNINNDTFLLSATFVGCVLFSEMTIIEAHTSPLSWPSFLCSAPASSPGARPPPRPCGGQRSKSQMCRGGGSREEVHTHTQVTELVLPERSGRAPTFHLPGTLLVDGATNLEEILPMQVCCRACRTTAGWLEHNITCNVFLGDLWKCNDRQQTLLHKLTKEGWIFPD